MLSLVGVHPLSPLQGVPHGGPGTASLGFSRATGRSQRKRTTEAGVCIGGGGGERFGGVRWAVLIKEKNIISRNLTGHSKEMNGKGF